MIKQEVIKGIKNNNGWKKIENKNDLDKIIDDDFYHCGFMDKNKIFIERINLKKGSYIKHKFSLGYINRYQPILKPKLPIY